MSSSTNKCYIDTSILPKDILSLQGMMFFKLVEDLTSDTVADLLRIQAIRNVRIFMLVPDVLGVLKIDSTELDYVRKKACFLQDDNSYIVKAGIETSIRYLRDLFAMKIHEYYYPNDPPQQQQKDSNTSASSDEQVPTGPKRPSSFPQPISNKRGRK